MSLLIHLLIAAIAIIGEYHLPRFPSDGGDGLMTRVGSNATASDELYSRAAGRPSGQVAGGSFYLRTAECLVALSQLD